MIDNAIFHDKKAAFFTLGCKLNFAETSTIGRLLTEAAYRKVKPGEHADVCVINTCSVTDMADKKCRQAIHRFTRLHPDAFIIVTGCYAQLKPNEIASIPGVDLVLGTNEKFDILTHLSGLEKKDKASIFHSKTQLISDFHPSCSYNDRTRFFLKVQDGCDYYCTYCTIPFARGKSRSGTIAQTVQQAQQAVIEGAKEIVLTGVNIGDFGRNTGESFLDLLKALDEIEGIARYRISSIEPNLLTEKCIDFVANAKRIAPHFHIPLQSGSNDVLLLMKRKYTRDLFAQRLAYIKKLMPQAFIGVDVIVGTRGETAQFFEDAYQFIHKQPISQLHVFTYSERAGTKALMIEHSVSQAEKKYRSEQLHQLSDAMTSAFYQAQIGKTAQVLWESTKKVAMMHGFTENYVKVFAPYNKSLVNTVQTVTLGGFSTTDDLVGLTIQ